MARYKGPRVRISRKYGMPIFGPSKYLERRAYPPGVHGPKKSRRKQSDYAIGLAEKQKLRYQYGLLERQFRRMFEIARKKRPDLDDVREWLRQVLAFEIGYDLAEQGLKLMQEPRGRPNPDFDKFLELVNEHLETRNPKKSKKPQAQKSKKPPLKK